MQFSKALERCDTPRTIQTLQAAFPVVIVGAISGRAIAKSHTEYFECTLGMNRRHIARLSITSDDLISNTQFTKLSPARWSQHWGIHVGWTTDLVGLYDDDFFVRRGMKGLLERQRIVQLERL